MTHAALAELPADSRLWVFPSTAPLEEENQTCLLEEVDDFLAGWLAHGRPLKAGRELRHGRFLIVAVDEGDASASGCSIDALVGRLRELGALFGTSFIDHSKCWYRDEVTGGVRCVSRPDFRALAESGRVGPETRVFDTTLTSLRDLRQRGLELPARKSWHAGLLRRSSALRARAPA